MNEIAHTRLMLNKDGQYDTGTKKWFLIRSWLSREESTYYKLEMNGYESYYPRITVHERFHLNKKVEPLFPGYIFFSMTMGLEGDDWLALNRLIWPMHVLKSRVTKTPEVVPDNLILTLKANETGEVIESGRKYRVGDPVRVKEGAFANFVSKIERLPGRERVAFLLNEIMVEMDLSEIEPVEE